MKHFSFELLKVSLLRSISKLPLSKEVALLLTPASLSSIKKRKPEVTATFALCLEVRRGVCVFCDLYFTSLSFKMKILQFLGHIFINFFLFLCNYICLVKTT